MSTSDSIAVIERALEKVKLPELARQADVPYTTLREWQSRGWKSNVVDTFEKTVKAARRVLDEDKAA